MREREQPKQEKTLEMVNCYSLMWNLWADEWNAREKGDM